MIKNRLTLMVECPNGPMPRFHPRLDAYEPLQTALESEGHWKVDLRYATLSDLNDTDPVLYVPATPLQPQLDRLDSETREGLRNRLLLLGIGWQDALPALDRWQLAGAIDGTQYWKWTTGEGGQAGIYARRLRGFKFLQFSTEPRRNLNEYGLLERVLWTNIPRASERLKDSRGPVRWHVSGLPGLPGILSDYLHAILEWNRRAATTDDQPPIQKSAEHRKYQKAPASKVHSCD